MKPDVIVRPLTDPFLDTNQTVNFLSWVYERAQLPVSVDLSFSSESVIVGISDEQELDVRNRLMIYEKPDRPEAWACSASDLAYRIDVWLRGTVPPFRVRDASIRCMSMAGDEPHRLITRLKRVALAQPLRSQIFVERT
jgi:hypothetical protein